MNSEFLSMFNIQIPRNMENKPQNFFLKTSAIPYAEQEIKNLIYCCSIFRCLPLLGLGIKEA